MIQYIVAAGVGGLLGLRRKKGKKFADGGTTDGKPKVTEIQESIFKMDGTDVKLSAADEVEMAWGITSPAEEVYTALAQKEIYLEEYAPELFEQDEDGVIEVGGIEDLKSGVTIEDIVDAIEDEPFMRADNSYNYSAPFVFDYRYVKTDDPYEEQIYFVREHRGGDVRGNYGPYKAVIMDSVEESPLYARVFVSLETDKGRVELESEDLEAYNFEVREDATGVLEQGEMVNIDELEEKFNFSGVKSDVLNIFAKGGQTDDDEARAKKEYMEDYGVDAEEADMQFYGVFRDKEDFAAEYVEDAGFDSFIDEARFLEPDKIGFREWATNLADAMAEDIDEDNADEYAERLGLEDEYEEAEEKGGQAMEDFLDELRQKEAEELYDEFMRQGGSAGDILDLVSDYGLDAKGAIDAYLVRVDYEEIADALEDDGFAYIEQGGELYVFDSNMARGGMTKMGHGGMHRQGYDDKLDESLGSRRGAEKTKEQSFKDRRDESAGMEKSMGRRKYAAVGTMDMGDRMMAEGGKTKTETRLTFFMAQQYLDKADKALSRGGEGFYTARKALEKAGEEIVEAAQMLPRDEGMEALRIILPPLRKAQKPAEKDSERLAAIGETQRAIEKFLTTTMQLKHGGQTQGYNDKLDESLGSRRGAGRSKEQSRKDRRDESEAMEKSMGRRKYAAVGTMDEGDRMMAHGGQVPDYLLDELSSQSGLRKSAVQELIKNNHFSKDDVVSIVTGIGRGQIEPQDVAMAFLMGLGSTENEELVEFAKSGKAFDMARGGKTKKIGFDKLAEEVAEEYREKGMSKAEAEEIGKGTAAKVYRAQQARKKRKK